MSVLTHVTLHANILDRRAFDAAATREVDEWRGQALRSLDTEQAGGHKVFCDAIYAACFNHVDPYEVEEFLRNLPWGYGWGVAVVDHEHDDRPRVIRLGRAEGDDAAPVVAL